MGKIACTIPTIRPEMMQDFFKAWNELFVKHNVEIIVIVDGEDQHILHNGERKDLQDDLVQKFYAGCCNLGYLYIAKNLPDVQYIINLNDDEIPVGDPIQDHINQLCSTVSMGGVNTCLALYPRGYPYENREAPVMLSHGVWEGVPDLDAPTQLVNPKAQTDFYEGKIPKGSYFPFCGMNYAFRREALPYIYHAPVADYKGAERFDDIWAGFPIVEDFAKLNWGIVTGYSKVYHTRASNVWNNLEKEYIGLAKNEQYWKGNYDEWYLSFLDKRNKWITKLKEVL